jgi:hypothetical protein
VYEKNSGNKKKRYSKEYSEYLISTFASGADYGNIQHGKNLSKKGLSTFLTAAIGGLSVMRTTAANRIKWGMPLVIFASL